MTDDTLVITAIRFADTRFWDACIELGDQGESFAAGTNPALRLPATIPTEAGNQEDKLVHVLVLSDGLHGNGSELVRGRVEKEVEGVRCRCFGRLDVPGSVADAIVYSGKAICGLAYLAAAAIV